MNSRLSSLATAARAIVDACQPVKRPYKVAYFKKVPSAAQPGMIDSVWTTEIKEAYNREDAAHQVHKALRPGYNCFVTRLMPWEVNEPAGGTNAS